MKEENVVDVAFTVRETSRYLNISTSTIYRYIKKGVITPFKEGGKWRLRKFALTQWMEERKKESILKWKPLGFSELQIGGEPVPIKTLRLMDSTGFWHRYRVSTVQGIFKEKLTRVPAWARLAKSREGKIGVLATGAHSGLLKIGRSRQSQPYFLTSFDALSKRVRRTLLHQLNYELIEEGGLILARQREDESN